ncbi:hypothetical protein PPO43_13940 [Saprospira sp. CCB-QB6]|uniref:YncE family protein n=1 Tax=Saprospira sp. CCB-QB6 TaxID=3023936 RepID=UPI00234AF38C|nr:DUF5074 domain-containing protein [Saprospira sp. CCB-QB6]WCL81071.1 hypothetical protein PPO43_13940 [Saprospira sp. CCB-QB6]
MKSIRQTSLLYIFLFGLLFTACKKEEPSPTTASFAQGVLITNEGLYNQTSGTISHYSPANQEVQNRIFKTVNQRDLGNVVQSLNRFGEHTYIVVNNSNKLEWVNPQTFAEEGQILNLKQPRYIAPINDSLAYISQWGNDLLSGSIAIFNYQTAELIGEIEALGKGPERLLPYNNKVFLCLVGGLETDQRLAVINSQTHQLEQYITVDDAPNSLQLDQNGLLWIACSGKAAYSNYPQIDTANSTMGSLIAIDPSNNQIIHQLNLAKGQGASQLCRNADGSQLFFCHKNAIYQLDPNQQSIQQIKTGHYYGLGFDNENNTLYAARYMGTESAWVDRLSLPNFTPIDSFRAGIFANDFHFQ